MNLRNLFLGVCLTVAVFAACQPQEGNLGTPDISINKTEMTFEMAGGEQELAVSATRDWRVETDAEWVVVSPESGSGSANPQTVTVSVLENTGYDRSAYLKFTIDMKSTYLTVSQVGPLGASIVYSNNFDKEVATQTYGSDPDDPKWPYLDEFDGWKNQTGKEIARVEHVFNGISCRNNSNSDGKYSDYAGSGKNNLLFSTNNHFAIKNLTLTSSRNYHISFGTTRYAFDVDDNTYNPSEFHVYVSADAQKWVELSYSFQDGFKNGRWDVASSTFTLPEGTATLHLYFKSDLSGAHRIDDLLLKPTETAGTVIDFANGQEFEVGGAVTPPAEITDVTVAEFNEKEVSTSVWYRLTGTVSGPIQATFGNFDLNDDTGKVFVYGISNWSSYSSKVKIGGTVTVVGTRGDFNGKIEVLNGYIEAYDPSTETGEDEPGTPEAPTEPGEYDPQGITWTLGTNAYDKTSGTNAQSAIVNGVGVANLLKLGTGSKIGDATLHVPAGTEKIGFYCVAWNGKTAQVKFSINGEELKTIEPKSNTGAANNAPYTITVTDSDYYVIDMPSTDAVDVKVETVDPANGRALFIKLEANPSSEGGEVTPPDGGEVTPPEGGETPEPGTVGTIADVLALGNGATIPANTVIEGVVISNMDLSNLTSKKGMYIQDESGAVQLRFSQDHTFAFGTKLQLDLSGCTVGAYAGAVQIEVAIDKATVLSSGNTVTPKTVTMADFLANKYEGQYIALEGVQVVSADLSKTFVMGDAHTSINMEDASGNKFVVFSSKYATYGTTAVPQGSGTIKGISSINNGTMQIIFCQQSDFAGLTGTRFDGTEVTPPAGGDDNQGGTEEPDQPDQPVTPPTTGNEAWKYEFKSGDFGSTYSAPVTKTFNDVEWTCTMIGSTYFGYDNNNGRGVQMGKSKEPATEITLSTAGITGNIKKVVVNTSGASGTDAKLNAKVGEVALGSQVSLTTTATDVTFETTTATAGVLELKWTLTTATAVYVKSITVYTE